MSWLLILGAKSDIGRACAHEFAAHGYNVALTGRNGKELEADASDLAIRYKVETIAMDLDVTDLASHEKLLKALPAFPDVVLSMVGYMVDSDTARFDAKEREQIFQVNFTGPAQFLSLVANRMEEEKKGAIIGVSSVAGDRGRQSNYAYGASKAGFSAFLSGLRHRLFQSGVHVMTVKPGFVATRMTAGMDLPARLTASPEKVAKDIFRAYQKKTDVLYTIWIWKYIMLIIKHLPEPIFKRTGL